MRVSRAEANDRLDAGLRRALRAEPYPTPAQRTEAWESVRARAVLQVTLPPETAATPWRMRLLACAVTLAHVLWTTRSLLLEDTAYHRARHEDSARTTAFMCSPYVQFQPMW
jgi:hypothetical protein